MGRPKTSGTGTYKYVPQEFLVEFDVMKRELKIDRDSDCFKFIAKSSRLGRELNKYLR
jgi:hypothetical protein